MHFELNIQVVSGAEIDHHLSSMARLRIKVFREFPYLYEGNEEYERKYLRKYSQSQDAVAVLAWKGNEVVGVSTGLPLEEEVMEVKRPFLEKGLDPKNFFYLSESVLLQEYRGLGIGHAFFSKREEHASRLGPGRFQHYCFCSVIRPKNHSLRPASWQPLDGFWSKRGYRPLPKLQCQMQWKDLGEEMETTKSLQFWLKDC